MVRHPVQTVCAHEDASGALWFGTVGFGLLRFSEGQFRAITTKAGLFDDVVYSMLEDGQGNLWMGSSRGIGRAKLKDLEDVAAGRRSSLDCLAIGKADGMLNVACSGGCQPAACRSRDGRLWFPTQKGLVCVDPRSIPFNILPPPVLVEEVRVNRKPVSLGSELSLGPRVGDIEFRYTALSLLVPQRVQFKVKLEGYDEDWISMGTQRGVTYARLPPGEYTFRVTACNNDGLWNEAGASVALRVKPHFYETGWFLALCALSALLLAYGFYGFQVRRLKIGKRKLQLLVEERTIQLGKTNQALEERSRQLEAANLQLRELSYRDALTGVANRRHFEEILDAEWRRAVRTGSTLAILMADVDSFKDYNDTFGHPGGDECLRRIASALQAGLRRAGDLLARYGGEEFVVVVSGASLGEAKELAEELRARVEALAIPHPGNVVGKVLTLSIGAASCFPRADRSPADLLASADHALYRAKLEGRNRVCTADEADR
jgi:diguanylate cyclase (GGDEF)-like protein